MFFLKSIFRLVSFNVTQKNKHFKTLVDFQVLFFPGNTGNSLDSCEACSCPVRISLIPFQNFFIQLWNDENLDLFQVVRNVNEMSRYLSNEKKI